MIYAIAVFVIIVDQLTKYLIVNNMKLFETVPIISGVFHITFVKNTGVAFGMLKGSNILFILLSILIMIGIIFYIYHAKVKNKLILISFGMILGGATGNLIDRFIHKGVIDFLDFRLINFPVFNIADSFVVIGCTLFAVITVFFDKIQEKGLSKDGEKRI